MWDFNDSNTSGGTFNHKHCFKDVFQSEKLCLDIRNIPSTGNTQANYGFPVDWVSDDCGGIDLVGSLGAGNTNVRLLSERPLIDFNKPWTLGISGRMRKIAGQAGASLTWGHHDAFQMNMSFDVPADSGSQVCTDGFLSWGGPCGIVQLPSIRFPGDVVDDCCYAFILSVDPCDHKFTLSGKVDNPVNVTASNDDTPSDPLELSCYSSWVVDDGLNTSQQVRRARVCKTINRQNLWKTFGDDDLGQGTGPLKAAVCDNQGSYPTWNSNGLAVGWYPSLHNCNVDRDQHLEYPPVHFYVQPSSGAGFVLNKIRIQDSYISCPEQDFYITF
jgi:hypothetical protein